MLFGYNSLIIFCHLSGNLNIVIFGHFDNESERILDILRAQLLLQFNAYSCLILPPKIFVSLHGQVL